MLASQRRTAAKKKQYTKRQRRTQDIKNSMGVDSQEAVLAMLNRACVPSPETVQDLCEAEVEARCGARYSPRVPGKPCRTGSDNVTVPVAGHKVAIKKPRMKKEGKELPLKVIEILRQNNIFEDMVMESVLSKTPMRQIHSTTEALIKSAGVSASTVSTIFQKGCLKPVETINTRSLADHEFTAIFIDPIYFGGYALISALGVNKEGDKIFLGFKEGKTENSALVTELLKNLAQRGLTANTLCLFMLDGKPSRKLQERFLGKGL